MRPGFDSPGLGNLRLVLDADAVVVIDECHGCGYPRLGPGLCAPCQCVSALPFMRFGE